MHACPVLEGGDAFLSGIDVGQDRFLCVQAPAEPSEPSDPVDIELDPELPRSFSRFFPNTPNQTWKRAQQNWLSRIFNLPVDGSIEDAPTATVLSTQMVEGNVTRRLVHYPSHHDGRTIPAYLFLPPGYTPSGSFQGALVLHGHFDEAKEGLGADWDSPLNAIGLYLAQEGFVTLAPDTRTWGDFVIPGQGSNGHGFATDLLQATTTGNLGQLTQHTLLDNLTSVGVLLATPGVVSVDVNGLSLGADQAMWLAAVDDRVSDVILAGNFLAFSCLNDPASAHKCQTVPALSASTSSPGRDLLLDAADVAGLIAPRRLYAMWGMNDGERTRIAAGGTEPCSETAAMGAQSVYDALGIGERFWNGAVAPIVGMGHELDTTSSVRFLAGRSPGDKLDYGSQCNGMHCCPAGKAMGGLQVSANDFICRDIVPPQFETCYIDFPPGTQRQNMHACAPGHYLRGIHVGGNRLTCCRDSRRPATLTGPEGVDSGTRVQGIRACPASRRFLTGVHVGSDLLLCRAP